MPEHVNMRRGVGRDHDTLAAERIYGSDCGNKTNASFFATLERKKAHDSREEFASLYDPKINQNSIWPFVLQTINPKSQLPQLGKEVKSIITGDDVTPETKSSSTSIHLENLMNTRKRKAPDDGIDLNLSLSMRNGESKGSRARQHWAEEEEVDSTLSLSLFPPSKREKACAVGSNMTSTFRGMNHEDSKFKNPTLASTLDLTI